MNFKHGLAKSPIYTAWYSMHQRCKKHACYKGRISVCKEWQSLDVFMRDMGPTFRVGLTLERKDNNGDYCKENCRWATMVEQSRNRRNNIVITHNGKTQILFDWAQEIGVNFFTLLHRYRKGKTPAEILNPRVAPTWAKTKAGRARAAKERFL